MCHRREPRPHPAWQTSSAPPITTSPMTGGGTLSSTAIATTNYRVLSHIGSLYGTHAESRRVTPKGVSWSFLQMAGEITAWTDTGTTVLPHCSHHYISHTHTHTLTVPVMYSTHLFALNCGNLVTRLCVCVWQSHNVGRLETQSDDCE